MNFRTVHSERDTARRLRSEQTEAESRFWTQVRNRLLLGYKFRRNHPFGKYFADFVCIERRLIVELDGDQHVEPGAVEYDAERTRYFESFGYRVVRISNGQVMTALGEIMEIIAGYLRDLGKPSACLYKE